MYTFGVKFVLFFMVHFTSWWWYRHYLCAQNAASPVVAALLSTPVWLPCAVLNVVCER